ncbi:MAG: DedA family protein [Fimbriimonadaceae bacterium]|nr:DedA family protein [Fimbriimonadaceae bacterium]
MGVFDNPELLRANVERFGPAIYLVLFAAFLFQTGFLIGPAIPGNPLIFVAGLLANPAATTVEATAATARTAGGLHLGLLIVSVSLGVFVGNLINYAQGKATGPVMKRRERWRGGIERAEAFFEKHGQRTVALATFVPFMRAFVPFVAGMGRMDHRQFVVSSAIGSVAWIGTWATAGYFLGQIPAVQANLTKIVFGIVGLVSIVAIVKVIGARRKARQS